MTREIEIELCSLATLPHLFKTIFNKMIRRKIDRTTKNKSLSPPLLPQEFPPTLRSVSAVKYVNNIQNAKVNVTINFMNRINFKPDSYDPH